MIVPDPGLKARSAGLSMKMATEKFLDLKGKNK